MAEKAQISNVVIEKDGKFLLVQEAKGIAFKLWNIPGGHIDEGETQVEAAIREALEETGYIVEIVKPVFTYFNPKHNSELHAFLGQIKSGSLQFPVEEILDAQWFSYEEILSKTDLREPDYIIPAITNSLQ